MVERFPLPHVALLFVDPTEDHYAPLASVGFDVTTQRRLRIPAQMLSKNSLLASGKPLVIESGGLAVLSSFFSSRSFSLLQTLELLPCRHQDSVFALLLLAYFDGESRHPKALELAEQLSALEHPFYESYAESLAPLPGFPADRYASKPLDLLRSDLHRANRMRFRVLCLLVGVPGLADSLFPGTVDVDNLRFREDLIRILNSFVSADGSLVPIGTDRVLLCIPSRRSMDASFVVSHIGATIRDFYHDLEAFEKSIEGAVAYPDEADTAETVFDRLGLASVHD